MLSSGRQPKYFLRVVVIAVIVCLLGVLVVSFVPSVRGLIHSSVLPLWRAGSVLDSVTGSVIGSIRSRASLTREIDRLEAELKTLQLQTLELPLLREENARLNELWQRRSFEESMLARVLTRPSASPYDTLVIDLGTMHGVSSGNLIVVEGVVIGTVADALPYTSVVRLFSSPGVINNVTVGESTIPVRVEGAGAGNFVAEVPRDIEMSEGSSVTFPDFSPRVFAIVERIEADASDPFRTAYFRLPVNLSQLDFVEVVVEGAHPLPSEAVLEDILNTEEEHDEAAST